MALNLLNILITCSLVYGFTMEDLIFAKGLESQEMIDKGRSQYQLLQERGKLPKYGTCWTAAVNQVHDGCRFLSEETQSQIALTLTNCFLSMSGHETYSCEHDKKPNLRGICISSMTDRAFNVYTEFYTHTTNMCWFLRGQVWQEAITENTYLVGKQLASSVENQATMLKNQKETLVLQEKMMNYTNDLNTVIEKFYESTKTHHELIEQMSSNLGGLQSWLIGEISFFNSICYYSFAILSVLTLTSIKRTAGARLPILLLVLSNFALERIICNYFSTANQEISVAYSSYYYYIVYLRYVMIFLSVVLLVLCAWFYRDILSENNALMTQILKKNDLIYECVRDMNNVKFRGSSFTTNGFIPLIKGTPRKSIDVSLRLENESSCSVMPENISSGVLVNSTPLPKVNLSPIPKVKYENFRSVSPEIECFSPIRRVPLTEYSNNSNSRYNLRNRNGTPGV